MRVLHLTRDFPPRSNGGLSIAVGGMVRAQLRAGVACSVVSFDDYRPKSRNTDAREPERVSDDSGLELLRVKGPAALERSVQITAEWRPDLVHLHHSMLWDFAAELARRSQARTLLTVHTLQAEQNRLRGIDRTLSSDSQRVALADVDCIHAPSRAVATALRAAHPDAAARVEVLGLGTRAWPGAATACAHERFGGAPLIAYVGRFADINGFAELLEALAELTAEDPSLRAVVAGGLPDNPRAERRWKERWARAAGERAHQLHFAGWLERDQLSALYARASALVVPSWFETFGQVLLEGMMHGTPLVTTGAGALAELVDASSALLVETQSASAIASGLRLLHSDPLAANERRVRAFARSQENRSWDDRMDAYLRLYHSLV